MKAEVISVSPDKITVGVKDLVDCGLAEAKLSVGSYLLVSDHDSCGIISIIESFRIETDPTKPDERRYVLETTPLGTLDADGKFTRGGNSIAIPPIGAQPASIEAIKHIYESQDAGESRFCFSSLARNSAIQVPVDGDRFFNKHIAVVGSTGSGKSNTVAKLVQAATSQKSGEYSGLNNSHIVIFDIHGEYRQAFPGARYVTADNLKLPYWMMNSEELEELFLESGDRNNYNQEALLTSVVTANKRVHLPDGSPKERVQFDTPVYFSIDEVINCLTNLSRETRDYKNNDLIRLLGDDGRKFDTMDEKYEFYAKQIHDFAEIKSQNVVKGTYADGTIDKFIWRLRAKRLDPRLSFLFYDSSVDSFETIVRQLLGYETFAGSDANVTVVDLSGVPFEVLSITVSLISRLLFDYCFFFKKTFPSSDTKTPVVVVYEEAHKYVPRTDASRYRAARLSIERVAKEGRKYGISAMIVSQRPSEVSTTIFAQCSNFVAMRLTNPEDQDYVKRLLPDSLESLTGALPILGVGEALLIGDAVVMPSLVRIGRCSPEPSSNDMKYLQEWVKPWYSVDFASLVSTWTRKEES